MFLYATQEFKLGSGGSNSIRAQLESVARQTGKVPKELAELVQLPDSVRYVWKCFIEMHNRRTSNGFSANPICYTEIDSYFNLHQHRPDLWEIQAINKLDDIALDSYAAEAKKEENKNKSKSK